VMAYEIVTGARPWADTGDVLSLVANMMTEAPPPIRKRVNDVSAVVEETILRALAKDSKARFRSMADIADALEPFASTTTGADRVQITPRARVEDPSAYAATTRIPTTVSVETEKGEQEDTASPKRRAATPFHRGRALAVPLFLLGALGASVYVV